jgi:DNA-directed RNA polymerase subunit alpha
MDMIPVEDFRMPEAVEVEPHTYSRYFGRFTAAPFERGYGITIGNALRRILLSSIEGAAVVAVRVNENLHEYASIPGVVEDVYEILLNLRHLVIRLLTDKPKRLYLRVDRKGPVYARDIEHDAEVEILEPDHYICTIGGDGYIELEMIVKKGRGFVPAERNQTPGLPRGFIPVSSIHSPVRKVNFRVEPTRVGQRTDYDRLILEIWTNGTVTPVEALRQATEIWVRHAQLFLNVSEPEVVPSAVPAGEPTVEEATRSKAEAEILQQDIAELGLSNKIVRTLYNNRIRRVAELVQMSAAELQDLPNVGPKSVEEIEQALQRYGLSLRSQ